MKRRLKKMQASLDDWIFRRRYRIVLLVLVAIILFAANFLPYINLISNTYLILLILLILTPIILDIEGKIFIFIGLLLFLFAFFIWSFGQTEEAEVLTDYVYAFMLAGSLKSFLFS